MNATTQDWPFGVRPLTPKLGVEISGVDLTADLADEVFRAIYRAYLQYQVLLFPPQALPPGRQVGFARRFGEVQIHVMNQYHADGYPELYRLSNLDAQGRPNGRHPDKGTLAWHTDGSWQRVTGQATIIYGEVMPQRNRKVGEVLEAAHLRSAEAEQHLVRPERGLAAGGEPRGERIGGNLADRRARPGERQLSHGGRAG